LLACRSEKASNEAMDRMSLEIELEQLAIREDMRIPVKGKATFMLLDLASLESVRSFTEAFKKEGLPLDVLVLNAGVMMDASLSLFLLGRRAESADGHEMHWAVNHLGHFLLANLLLPKLEKSKDGRIIVLSSS
ncbi:unnamed protein product, partial [Phaeothamnion confervicola]